jgi:hypothetical protein
MAAVALLVGCGAEPTVREVQLPRRPYVGLACNRTPASCDRIGLAVWLGRAAVRVTAVIGGHSLALRTGGGTGAYRHGRFWQGFVRDRHAAQLAGDFPTSVVVRVRIVATDGGVRVAEVTTPVSGGYG